MTPFDPIRETIAETYRSQSRRVFATLVRILGDFDLAEEALHEAFAAAVEKWPRDGVPSNPRAWLVSAGRFRAIDAIRRRERFDDSVGEIARRLTRDDDDDDPDDARWRNDPLRLVFTCCHPALPATTQVALTLREVCGLTTEEIASAFLTTAPTIAQRIVRGKAKIKREALPYEVPALEEMPERLETVLTVIYLVFNEGYSASSGEAVTRADLSGEAIRLARLLRDLLPDPEVSGLLALLLLHESRREARADPSGDIVLLEDQDRSRWDRGLIDEGRRLVEVALSSGRAGAYTIQAAIAALHAEAPDTERTDWAQIAALYGVLLQAAPNPVVELNRAVAIAMRDGPEAGLELIDGILARGDLARYHLAHAARADLCRRLGRASEARASYEAALALAQQAPERRFLEMRLRELG